VAERLIEETLQFNSVVPVLLVIPAVGAVVLRVVVAEAVAVQPLLPVTVTVNVPAALTVMAEVVAPLLHSYAVPPLAVKVVDGVVQFSASPLLVLMLAVGAVLSSVVVALVVAVHPLLPITVTVNVAAVLTVMAEVVAPIFHS
jgi:hypothetical protein